MPLVAALVAVTLRLASPSAALSTPSDIDQAAGAVTAGLAEDLQRGSTEAIRVSFKPLTARGVAPDVADALTGAMLGKLESPPFELLPSTFSEVEYAISGKVIKADGGVTLSIRTAGLGGRHWHTVEQYYFASTPVVAPPDLSVSSAPAPAVDVATAPAPAADIVAISTPSVSPPPAAWIGGGLITPNGAVGYGVDVTLRDPGTRWQAGGEIGGAVHKDLQSDTASSRFSTVYLRARADALFPFERRVKGVAALGLGLGLYRTQEETGFSDGGAARSVDHDQLLPSVHAGVVWPLGAAEELRTGVEYILQTRSLGTGGYRFGGVAADVSLGLQL